MENLKRKHYKEDSPNKRLHPNPPLKRGIPHHTSDRSRFRSKSLQIPVFSFKARRAPKFLPPKSLTRSTLQTIPINSILHSTTRAFQRALFDQRIQHLQQEKENQLKIQQEELEIMEKQEVKKLRKQMEFKARPIAHYSSQPILYPRKPLTVACSPFLNTKSRAVLRK